MVKREFELKNLLDAKIGKCISQLGEQKYNEILGFFRKKLNIENDFTADDYNEIDEITMKNINQYNSAEVINTIYKILHLEIEVDKCKEQITSLAKYISHNN